MIQIARCIITKALFYFLKNNIDFLIDKKGSFFFYSSNLSWIALLALLDNKTLIEFLQVSMAKIENAVSIVDDTFFVIRLVLVYFYCTP